MKSKPKLWGGRFNEATDQTVEEFTASVHFDQRLYRYDIVGSIAHANMLGRIGVLSDAERDSIIEGLQTIEARIDAGNFNWSMQLEDVHMNIEAQLTELIGEVGKKLHTGRSRNDQVVTDMRLCVRETIDHVSSYLGALQKAVVDLAEQEADTIMPGMTHMQVAQPITLGHHLLAWFEMLQRDRERFQQSRNRVNQLPLGSAALAGTSFPVDRQFIAEQLEFEGLCENSMDAVSDRDFIIEFVSNATITMMHLSRISEELVLWSSERFGFIELGDQFCTGSSIMPQKKNPDVAELIRGRIARVCGNLNTLLILMKAQPLAYNRDNQEDKEPLFDTIDTVSACLNVLAAMIPSMKVKRDVLRDATENCFSTATDMAEYLVRKGVPFRDAHEIVGKAVRHGLDSQQDLSQMNLETLQGFSSHIEKDIFSLLTAEGSVAARNHIGGTAPEQVRLAITRARQRLSA